MGKKVTFTAVDIESFSYTRKDEDGIDVTFIYYYIVYEYKNKENEIREYIKLNSINRKPRKKLEFIVDAYFYKGLCFIDD